MTYSVEKLIRLTNCRSQSYPCSAAPGANPVGLRELSDVAEFRLSSCRMTTLLSPVPLG